MKIAILTPYFPPESNGISFSVLNRIISINRLGYECLLLVPNYQNNEQEYILKKLSLSGIQIERYSTMKMKGTKLNLMPSFRKCKYEIRKAVNEFSPNIVIIDDPFIFYFVGGFSPIFRNKTKKTLCVGISNANVYKTLISYKKYILALVFKYLVPYVYNKFDLTIFPSKFLYQSYPSIRNGRIITFLGVDKNLFKYQKRKNHTQEVTVISVGRLEPDKNIKFLFEAAKKINKIKKSIKWIFIGSGSEYRLWKERETEYIRFLGEISNEDLPEYYFNSDIFVTACNFESFGLSIAEAMSTGLPVLVPDNGGASEKFLNNISGYTYRSNDFNSFNNVLISLIENPIKRQKSGIEASKNILSWQEAISHLISKLIDYGQNRNY